MKKLSALIWSAVLLSALLAGCQASPKPPPSGSPSPSPSASASASPSSPASASPASSPGSAKMGMAVMTSLSKSKDAGEKDGVAEVDSTVVAVLLDKDGKIQRCVVDAVQAQIGFDDKGKLTLPPTMVFKTKNELGVDYGMKKASGIGREWYEQAAAFAKYVEGKTPDEVKNIKVDDRNSPTEADLKASVTISVGSFMETIEKAAAAAQEGGASPADILTVGVVTTMAKSADATAEKAGVAEVDSTYVALTRDAGGKITACIIDGTQSKISFTAQGKITTDLSETPKTKNELGEAYGMKKASGIGKEWNEQAAAFAEYVTGKTPAEIAGIAVDEKGYSVASDVKASVTIKIIDFKAAIAKATSSQ